jgi:hypothetical protein
MLVPIDTASAPNFFSSPLLYTCTQSTNDNLALLGEVVRGDLEVERRRSLSYATRDIVVGSVAGAEPAAEVAGLADGHTTKMGADTYTC